ncbi:MAG: type II secretion system protein [Bacillota bacterium]
MHKLLRRVRRDQKGFTLIELLVVVAIIGLLAAFAVPKLFEAINKAKAAPGQADIQTMSGALERFYLDTDLGNYPSGTAAQVMTALRNGYLKGTTDFRNGYRQGYIYGVTTDHRGYILIDPQGATANQLTCGAGNVYAFTMAANGLTVLDNEIDPAHLPNCTAPTGMKLVTN